MYYDNCLEHVLPLYHVLPLELPVMQGGDTQQPPQMIVGGRSLNYLVSVLYTMGLDLLSFR